MNLLATTDILNSLKMGERLKRSNLKPYGETALPKGKVKISPASVLSLNQILVTNLSQGQSKGEKSRFTMQERFITLLAFDNLITSSCLAV